MTYHPRSEWAQRQPKCVTRFNPDEVVGVAVHWNGPAVTLPPAAQLRADERYHMDAKDGCAIFYSLCVDQMGGVWEARGLTFRSGANGAVVPNRRYVSICGLLGVGQHPTAAMHQGFRDAITLTRQRYPHATEIRTHNDVRPEPTACPGPDLTAAVRNGTLEPAPAPAPPDDGDDDMPAGPAAVHVGDTLYTFARSPGDELWYSAWKDGSPVADVGWANLNGVLTSAPTAAEVPGGIIVMARGTDGAVWARQLNVASGTWGGWFLYGGQVA